MGPIVLLLAGLFTGILAKPGILSSSLIALAPGAPVGPDGRVVDTPEVADARAAHAAAQVNERISLANEAARSVIADLNGQLVSVVTNGLVGQVVPGVTIGPDGRVQDTPEVAAARAAHAAAQINERINLANEAVRSGALVTGPTLTIPLVRPEAPIGPDGRVQDTPEVAVAKTAHAAAHLNEKLNLAAENRKSANVLAIAGPALAYGRLVY